MRRQITFSTMAALVLTLLAPVAWAQMATIHGTVRDADGKPIPGAFLQLQNKENGRRYENMIKTNGKGDFNALGIQSGTYVIRVVKDGKQIFELSNVPIRLGEENLVNVDLQREQAQQAEQLSPEQKKAIEEQQKEATKIKGLNDRLAAAKAAEDAGNAQQAVQILTEATQIDATQPVLWVRLADTERVLAKQQMDATERKATYTKAVADYQKAIALKPTGAYYNNMADAMARMGDFDGAIKAYEQAASMDPPNASMYYFNEGAVLTNSGKADEANVAFDKAIAADPTKAEAYYQKGVNLLSKATIDKTGKMVAPPEAEQALNKYLELAPTGPNAEAAKQLLASLGATIETSFGKAKPGKKK